MQCFHAILRTLFIRHLKISRSIGNFYIVHIVYEYFFLARYCLCIHISGYATDDHRKNTFQFKPQRSWKVTNGIYVNKVLNKNPIYRFMNIPNTLLISIFERCDFSFLGHKYAQIFYIHNLMARCNEFKFINISALSLINVKRMIDQGSRSRSFYLELSVIWVCCFAYSFFFWDLWINKMGNYLNCKEGVLKTFAVYLAIDIL